MNDGQKQSPVFRLGYPEYHLRLEPRHSDGYQGDDASRVAMPLAPPIAEVQPPSRCPRPQTKPVLFPIPEPLMDLCILVYTHHV